MALAGIKTLDHLPLMFGLASGEKTQESPIFTWLPSLRGWVCHAALGLFVSCVTAHAANTTAKDINSNQAAVACEQLVDTLAQVKCEGILRVGVLSGIKGFSQAASSGEFEGFEIDLGKRLAADLGVKAQFVPVSPALRIQPLVDDQVDLVIANLTDTEARRETIRFIRPHYFSSATILMAHPEYVIHDRKDIRNLAVCVPLGNFSNVSLISAQARLLIYDKLESLISAIEFGACQAVAHDRILLEMNISGPDAPESLRTRFEEKIALTESPWGIAISNSPASDTLKDAITDILINLHASGFLVDSAGRWGILVDFLRKENAKWSGQDCRTAAGAINPDCLFDPVPSKNQPSVIAQPIRQIETWLDQTLDFYIKLPMFTTEVGLQLLMDGVVTSLILAFGSIIATLLFSVLMYKTRITNIRVIKLSMTAICTFLQYCPQLPLMLLAYFVVASVVPYSPAVALATAIGALGLYFGASASNAMCTALASNPGSHLTDVMRQAAIPIRLNVIFTVKLCPVAAFIGVPELLTVLNEITAFSGERFSTLFVVSMFYIGLILAVSKFSQWVTVRVGELK